MIQHRRRKKKVLFRSKTQTHKKPVEAIQPKASGGCLELLLQAHALRSLFRHCNATFCKKRRVNKYYTNTEEKAAARKSEIMYKHAHTHTVHQDSYCAHTHIHTHARQTQTIQYTTYTHRNVKYWKHITGKYNTPSKKMIQYTETT